MALITSLGLLYNYMDVKYKRKSEIPDFTHKRVHMYDEGMDIVDLI